MRLVFLSLFVFLLLSPASKALEKSSRKTAPKPPSSSQRTAQAKQAQANTSSPAKPPAKTILFAVSQRDDVASLEPIVVIQNGRYTNPPAGDANIAEVAKFANDYYRAGAKYRLLFGGAEAGAVEVKRWNLRKECSRTEAIVKITGTDVIKGRVMGLATDAKDLGRNSRSRRPPTPTERAAVEQLARTIYVQKGVSEAQIRDGMRYVNETATDLNGDGKAEIVATFIIKRTKDMDAIHILFLIAEPNGTSYKAAISQYGKITARDLGGSEDRLDDLGKNTLPEVLIDQIDLDKDGMAEVIIADLTEKGVVYKIYKKDKKKGWRRVYEFSNYRCAS